MRVGTNVPAGAPDVFRQRQRQRQRSAISAWDLIRRHQVAAEVVVAHEHRQVLLAADQALGREHPVRSTTRISVGAPSLVARGRRVSSADGGSPDSSRPRSEAPSSGVCKLTTIDDAV